MPSFGENLRELRRSRGYSQDRFAREINSNQVNVSAWELGNRMPSLSTIQGIADVFHVPLSSLISLEETGLDDDYVREVADLLKHEPKLRILIDKAKYLSEQKLDVVISVISAIAGDAET